METQLTNEELEKVVDQVKNHDSSIQQKRFRLWSINDIVTTEFGKDEWLVDKLIPSESITILSGHPGSFKSWLTIEMAKCVSLGKPFLDKFKTTQGAVVMVDEENNLRHLKNRIAQLEIPNDAKIYYLPLQDVKVDAEGEVERLIEIAKSVNAKLMVFDPLVRIHGRSENDSGGMAYVFEQFKKLAKSGIGVVITHHHRKQETKNSTVSLHIRGSSDILAAVDCHIATAKQGNEIVVCQNKLRIDKATPPFKIIAHLSEKKISFEFGGMIGRDRMPDKAEAVILELLKEGEFGRESIDLKFESLEKEGKIEHMGSNSIGEALKNLTKNNKISVHTGASNKKYYTLILEQNGDENSQKQVSEMSEEELIQLSLALEDDTPY